MTKLVWDDIDSRRYETGVDRGVYYPKDGSGEVWNGLTSVQESPSDSDEKPRYIDGIKVRSRRGLGEFSGSIEAFTYPPSFGDHLVMHQRRNVFDMSYRVMTKDFYKIHLVYNVLVSPTNDSYQHEEVSPFSWDFTTRPVAIPGSNLSAHLVIDTAKAYPETVTALEELLYGYDLGIAHMPTPDEVLTVFEENSLLRVIDNGDGSFTVTGPDSAILMIDATTFEITWDSAVMIDAVSYTISSL